MKREKSSRLFHALSGSASDCLTNGVPLVLKAITTGDVKTFKIISARTVLKLVSYSFPESLAPPQISEFRLKGSLPTLSRSKFTRPRRLCLTKPLKSFPMLR